MFVNVHSNMHIYINESRSRQSSWKWEYYFNALNHISTFVAPEIICIHPHAHTHTQLHTHTMHWINSTYIYTHTQRLNYISSVCQQTLSATLAKIFDHIQVPEFRSNVQTGGSLHARFVWNRYLYVYVVRYGEPSWSCHEPSSWVLTCHWSSCACFILYVINARVRE